MKDKQAKYPQLRFKGFTDPWVQRNLGDLAEIVRGASPRPIQDPKWFDDSSEIGWLRISDVTEQNGRIHHLDQHISEAGQAKTRVLTEPHLLLSIAATVGKPLVNYVKTGVHDGFLIFMNPKFDLEFMFQWLESYRDKWSRYGQPGSQVNLNSDLVKNQSISIPSMDEQQKLGEFFTSIDNLIAANQRKLDLLKEQKKGYLQKMFPKNGSKVPELRFAGFADAWEQRKLGDLGDILRKSIDPQLTPSREFVEYSMPSYDRGKRPNRVLGESMQSTRLKISGTVLLINKLNVRQRRIWFVKKAPENAVASGEFVPFQSFEIDLGFLHQLFLSDKTTSELQSISSGTSNSQKRVTPSDLLHYPICIPTTKGEQVVVGRFLSSIDNLITLHQRKLDLLKEQKKGFLQNMFV